MFEAERKDEGLKRIPVDVPPSFLDKVYRYQKILGKNTKKETVIAILEIGMSFLDNAHQLEKTDKVQQLIDMFDKRTFEEFFAKVDKKTAVAAHELMMQALEDRGIIKYERRNHIF